MRRRRAGQHTVFFSRRPRTGNCKPNFVLEGGPGVLLFMCQHAAIDIGYRVHHIAKWRPVLESGVQLERGRDRAELLLALAWSTRLQATSLACRELRSLRQPELLRRIRLTDVAILGRPAREVREDTRPRAASSSSSLPRAGASGWGLPDDGSIRLSAEGASMRGS